ncbi:AAA family ATPase [Amphritea sp. HPY]|uniref:ExeA family protein n=1 Tax=Amphritea sp. HPY TaxID=3421652 RepID=UPI003D7DFC25
MYSNYFGLEEPPFSIAPNPRYLYLSKQHREALAHLLYGIGNDGGFVLLTGEVGTGKTTVCRALLDQLPEATDVALILNPKYSSQELLASICDELGITYPQHETRIKHYIDALTKHLLQSHAEGRHTVLILDEAQNLGVDVLEQIRLLTNLETDCHKLLQIVLVGQPELLEQLLRPELRQLSQRITARFHLGALNRSELEAYISHRLAVAGVQGRLFPAATLNRLYRMTRGVPRLINILCDRALLGAFVERQSRVEVNVLKRAASEVLGGDSSSVAGWMTGWMAGRWQFTGLAVAVLLLLTWLFVPGVKDQTRQWGDSLFDNSLLAQERVLSADADLASGGSVPSSLGLWSWPDKQEYQLNQIFAYQSLFDVWGVEYRPKRNPIVCKFARSQGYACLFGSGELESLIGLNRPAVLKLVNQKGEDFFATLVAIDGERADIRIDGRKLEVSLAELKRWWRNVYTVFWQMPPGYDGVIQPGNESRNTLWLDKQLALIQGRRAGRRDSSVYDWALVKQVKQFQQSKGLTADGIVGPKTSIHLNTATGQSVPLLLVP